MVGVDRAVRATGAEAVELLMSRGHLTHLTTPRRLPALSIANSVMGPLSLGRARFEMSANLRGNSPGVIGIGRVRTGRLSYAYGGDELRWTKADLFVAVDPASEYVLHVDDVDVDHTMIDLDVLAQVAEAPATQRLRLTGHAPVSRRAATTWMQVWSLVTDLAGRDTPGTSTLVAGQAARMLAAVTLAGFPNNAVVDTDGADHHDAHPATVRRAVSFIEAHPDLDLSVSDIAGAAHVSIRALQLAFRRHLDTTPMAYLRRVRLDRARAELRAADPGTNTTVADIALRWGWGRPSRFAADYRAAYGSSPWRLLRDAR